MALLYSNNASSTLAADLAIGGTTLSLFAGTGALFPNPTGGDYFKLTLEDSAGNVEIVHCTARTADSCTIVRAQEGTTARAFSTGAAVENRFTAGSIATFNTYAMASNAQANAGTATNLIMNPATTKYFWDQRVTPFAATVLDDTDASSALTTLGVSTYAKTLLDDTDAATMHTTLGLGTAATKDAGVGAGNLVQLNASGQLPAVSGALLTGLVALPQRHITGFVPTFTAFTSTTAAMTMSAGALATGTNSATSDTIVYPGGTWAVSNGNAINGYQGGTTLPANSTIHILACEGTSGVGLFAYAMGMTAALPAGYNLKARRVYAFITGASGEILARYHQQLGGGQLLTLYPQAITDVSVASHTNGVLYALSVPIGIKVQPLFRGGVTGYTVLFTSPGFENDVASPLWAAWTASPGYSVSSQNTVSPLYGNEFMLTDTAGRIRARCSTTGQTLIIHTRGFIDFREEA